MERRELFLNLFIITYLGHLLVQNCTAEGDLGAFLDFLKGNGMTCAHVHISLTLGQEWYSWLDTGIPFFFFFDKLLEQCSCLGCVATVVQSPLFKLRMKKMNCVTY